MLKFRFPDWNWTAGLPLLCLVAIAILGLSFPPPQSNAQLNTPNQSQQIRPQPENNNASVFLTIGDWADTHRETIEALTAIGGLLIAVALAVLTAWLAFATSDLAKSTRELAAGAEDQAAETAKATALAEKQFLLTGEQFKLSEKQLGLQREQFFAQYRPALVIQFVQRLPAKPRSDDIDVEFTIINAGLSECTVLGSRVQLDWMLASDIPSPHDLKGKDIIPRRRFLRGATDRVTISRNDAEGVETFSEGKLLYLLGWVVYVDGRGEEFGSTRTTYFIRQYNAVTRKFVDARTNGGVDWEWESAS